MSCLPYLWKKTTALKSELYNRLFQQARIFIFPLNGISYQLEMIKVNGKNNTSLTAQIQVEDGIQLECDLENHFLSAVLSDLPHMEDYETLPEIVRSIALEVVLEKILDGIDRICGCQSRIIHTTIKEKENSRSEDDPFELTFNLKRREDGFLIRGIFRTDVKGMIWMLDQLDRFPHRQEEREMSIPLKGCLEMGHTGLSIRELNALGEYDILLFEVPGSMDKPGIIIRLSQGYAMEGIIASSNKILIRDLLIGGVGTTPEMEKKMSENNVLDSSLNDIPVTLVFELGDTNICLGELKKIQPGYTLNLDKNLSLDKPITIKANGVGIGKGEIIQVGNQIGVRVLEISNTLKEKPQINGSPDEQTLNLEPSEFTTQD